MNAQTTMLRARLDEGWSYALALCVDQASAEAVLRRAWSRAVARCVEDDRHELRELVREEALRGFAEDVLDEPSLGGGASLPERFAQLSAAEREAVYLHSAVHLDESEIAAQMGVTPQAVRAWVWRGLERLRHLAGRAGRP